MGIILNLYNKALFITKFTIKCLYWTFCLVNRLVKLAEYNFMKLFNFQY